MSKRKTRIAPTLVLIFASMGLAVACEPRPDWVYDDETDGGESVLGDGGKTSGEGGKSTDAEAGAITDANKADTKAPDDGGVASDFSVGGSVTGLFGAGLVLQNQLGDDLPVAASGAFSFPKRLNPGAPYDVTVKTNPSSPFQTCVVTNGSGTVGAGDVTNVQVTCTTNTYSVGGNVVGLVGTGLVLQDNGGGDITVSANGSFVFPTPIASGSTYNVTVKTQPQSPTQTCSVSGGNGVVESSNVTSIVVNCGTNTYTVGGTITGLEGSVVLKNKGGDDLTLTSNGTFAFSTPVASGSTYDVTVSSPPMYPPRRQTCVVTSGTGSVSTANVTNVNVACTTSSFTVGGTVSGLTGTVVLRDNGADDKTLSANGAFTFATPVLSGDPYAVTVRTQPNGQKCAIANGSGTVGNGNVTTPSVTCVNLIALSENFDGVTAPALPAGWTSTLMLAANKAAPWKTVTTQPDSPPNAAWAGGNITSESDTVLDSPAVTVVSSTAQLTFRHWYLTESGGDGGVLEIKIGSGAFVDFVTAGGSITADAGGYPRTMNVNYNSPIKGRYAWTGDSGGYVQTTATLPASAAGQSIQLRWRYTTDSSVSVSGSGWWVDNIVLTN